MRHYLNNTVDINNVKIANIFEKYVVLRYIKENSIYYEEYYIEEGETPETVSNKFYKTYDWFWLILLYNDIVDPWYGWPLSYLELENYAKTITEDWQNNMELFTMNLTIKIDENEKLRKIKILKPEYLDIIVKNYMGIK